MLRFTACVPYLLALVLSCNPASTLTRPASPTPPAQAVALPATPTVMARVPTASEAFDQLWSTLRDMPFFRENGYEVGLPDDPLFQQLATDGIDGLDHRRPELMRHFDNDVYDPEAFAPAIRELDAALLIANRAVSRIGPWARAWSFRTFERYEVVLTLYGPGGSYDSNAGRVTLFTDAGGKGRFGKPFAHTIVHEIVHIGIQKNIVEARGLSHQDKERLVDRVCVVGFSDLLPSYRAQAMGNPALDAYVTASTLQELPTAVDRFLREHEPAL